MSLIHYRLENLYESTNNLTLKTGEVTFNTGNNSIGTYSAEFEHSFKKSFNKKCVGVFVQNVGYNEEMENLIFIKNIYNYGFSFQCYRISGSNLTSGETGNFVYLAVGY